MTAGDIRTGTDPDGDFDGAVPDPDVVAQAWEVWRAEATFADQFVAQAPDLDVRHADLLRERIDGRLGQ
ncbi:MAG TPA: hypothetical protein VMV17_19360 [Streptosporangiaceae bacterium]|nr:hypothetical protein [Streptosporangiaceae bacterium]